MKNKNQIHENYSHFTHMGNLSNGRSFLRAVSKKLISIVSIIALVLVWGQLLPQPAKAVGIDNVTVTLSVETVGAASQVTVVFASTVLTDTEAFTIYLGEDTTGDEWGLNAVTTTDISCTDNGTGETYTVNSVTAASATLPMRTQITATTVGAGATLTTCLIGDGTPNPTNPATADGYSVAVATAADSGAGIAYVGNANDITVSVTVLPNLSLTIDGADGSNCTTASGITTCNLGTVLTTTVATGSYDVNVGTNAGSGATMSIAEDGNMRNGANDINDVVEGNTVTANTEGYGVAVVATANWSEQGDFTDDDTPIATGPTTVATSAGPIDYTDELAVTHRAAISAATLALTYSHIVTWTATANF